ncbi:hypothetical protein [Neobacillus kokaensis]|uniref:Uncharacterized protein n=1 Tax=Neobacillus kokaensis TaxID=2759023 RepID=A0ABQ3NB56_9BACI|nr:hypothetical protein [Neobacillus kokaensis]GHI01146.1 hypothetical protein AM1BK_46880 [Neobacillus kokaensis]
MELLFGVFIVAILGTLWFLNLTALLVKLKMDKSIQNQVILGAVLTFILIFAFMMVSFIR